MWRPWSVSGSSASRSATKTWSTTTNFATTAKIGRSCCVLRCRTCGSKPLLSFGIELSRQRTLLQHRDIVVQVRWVRRADDRGVQIRVGEGEAQDELHGSHIAKQAVKIRPLPPIPLQAPLLSLGRRALRGAATDDDTCPGVGGCRNDRLVFAFHGGVGNLEHV